MTYLASSAGALIVDRNTWTARANQAWGPSDVWNSGNSWEYLTGYHGWVGRSYNVGESWENAYGRVYTDRYNEGYAAGNTAGLAANLPAGSGGDAQRWNSGAASFPTSGLMTWSGAASGPVSSNSGGVITLVRYGYYVIRVRCQVSSSGYAGSYCELALTISSIGGDTSRVSDTVGGATICGPSWEGTVAAGARQVTVTVSDKAGSLPNPNIYITFVPTPTYPH